MPFLDHVLEGAVLLALATGWLYFLGARAEFAYLKVHGLPFYQFMPSTKDLLFKGWEGLMECLKANRVWLLTVILLTGAILFGLHLKGTIDVDRAYKIAAGVLALLASVFSYVLLGYSGKRGKRWAQDQIAKPIRILVEVKGGRIIQGALITFVDGTYAVREIDSPVIHVFREEQLEAVRYLLG